MLSELPLYLALLTHRFVISTRKVKVVTYVCLLWSATVRMAEAVVLIAYFAGTLARMRRYVKFLSEPSIAFKSTWSLDSSVAAFRKAF